MGAIVGDHTRKGTLSARAGGATLPTLTRDPDALPDLLRRDRIRRRMTWPAYASFLGVPLPTLHKIANRVHRASELTEGIIRERLTADQ